METDSQPTLSIPMSKSKTALIALGSFLFAVGGLAMCVVGLVWPIPGVGIGAAAALFFGPIGVFATRRLLDPTPALLVDATGIVDNSSAVSVGKIAWAEITAISTSEVVGQRFVNIHVVDPSRFLSQGNVVQRFFRRLNARMVGTPISISPNALPLSFDDLHSLLVRAFESYKPPGTGV
ncbi:MAG: hypothetical protein DCC68_06430 [Planctomycetota bacterium]|nr:MAG: hypothetical protein DCC68_06430 [Planctomycetota bacterium]